MDTVTASVKDTPTLKIGHLIDITDPKQWDMFVSKRDQPGYAQYRSYRRNPDIYGNNDWYHNADIGYPVAFGNGENCFFFSESVINMETLQLAESIEATYPDGTATKIVITLYPDL